MSGAQLPALARTVADLVEEYEAKSAAVPDAIRELDAAFTRFEMGCTVQGFYVGNMATKPHVYERTMQANLLKSGWRAIYSRLNIAEVASAADKKRFERALEDPAPLTYENARATFGDYLMRPRFHVLRGLAEVFCDLDPAYRSHSKVKVGVAGLPKRIILSQVAGWGSYGRDKLKDVLSALAAVRGQPIVAHEEFGELDKLSGFTHKAGEVEIRGLAIRKFQNGNAHVIFPPDALLEINLALAEFYGDVLPDAEESGAKPRASTAVAKDLQFYWSPQAVAEAACDFAGIHRPSDYARGTTAPQHRALEPSCGDGRIMDELRRRGCRSLGIEFDAGRAEEARAKGHSVVVANFLDQPPAPEFDFVVMNPPFYGRHYAKHVRHALKFLRPGGTLVSILPASARYDHGEIDGEWQDLPVASFAEAGTNIPTTLLRIRK